MTITIRSNVAPSFDDRLDHIAPHHVWTIEETTYSRIPGARSQFDLAWQLITLHLNGWTRLMDQVKSDPDAVVADASIRWEVNKRDLVTRARDLHRQIWSHFGPAKLAEATADTGEDEQRFHPSVKNICGLNLTIDDLTEVATLWMERPLQDERLNERDRLLQAAAGALNFVLLCFTNIQTKRSLVSSDPDPILMWGGNLHNVNRRVRLHELGLAPTPEIGTISDGAGIIREELIHKVLKITEVADIDPAAPSSTIFEKVRNEFTSMPKRANAIPKVANGTENLGAVLPEILYSRVQSLLTDDLKDILLIAPSVVTHWRTMRAAELKSALAWVLERERDEKVINLVERNLGFNHPDVPTVAIDKLSVCGYRDLLALMGQVRSASDSDARRTVYDNAVKEIAERRPGRPELGSFELVKELPLAQLFRSVYLPVARFASTTYEDKASLKGLVAAGQYESRMAFNLGKPRFVVQNERTTVDAKAAEVMIISLLAVRDEKDGPVRYTLPVKYVDVKVPDSPLSVLTKAVQDVYEGWYSQAESLAELSFHEMIAEGGSVENDRSGASKEFNKWLRVLATAKLAKTATLDVKYHLRDVPSYIWQGLGLFVDSELQIRKFELVSTDTNSLERMVETPEGFIRLLDRTEFVEPVDVLARWDKPVDYTYEWLNDSGVLPYGLVVGDEAFEPRIITPDGSDLGRTWWAAHRNMVSEHEGTGFDLRRVANDLCETLPISTFSPNVPFLKEGHKASPILIKNGLQQVAYENLLQFMLKPEVMQFKKSVVRDHLFTVSKLVLEDWKSRLSMFHTDVALVAPFFLRGVESADWFRTVIKKPEEVKRFTLALGAMFASELGSDAMALQYLQYHGCLNEMISTKSISVIPELWSPEDPSVSRPADLLDRVVFDEEHKGASRVISVFKRIDTALEFMMNRDQQRKREAFLRTQLPIDSSAQ